MKILGLQDLKNYTSNSIITIGFFDGVHLGHQMIINTMVKEAKKNDLKSVVISFDDSILKRFKMTSNIYTLKEKEKYLKEMGVDYLLLLKDDDNVINYSAFEFKNEVLDKLKTKIVVSGSEFSFAKNKEGNATFIKEKTNYRLIEVGDVFVDNIKVSSTYIRNLLKDGNITLANELLYANVYVRSRVKRGKQIGRTLHFNTANLSVSKEKMLLKQGVYFGRVYYLKNKYYAIVNIGNNPTIAKNNKITMEVHILDFNEDIYGKNLTVFLDFYNREEIKFDNRELLEKQINKDKEKCREYYNL